MKSPLLVLAMALTAFGTAPAAPFLGLQTNAFSIGPGDSFTVTLALANPESLAIAGFNITVSASTAGVFELDGWAYPTVINDPNSSIMLPNYGITTGDSADLGATSDFLSSVQGTNVVLATYSFQALTSAPGGEYVLWFGGPGPNGVPTLSDASFSDYDNPTKLQATVTIVPEPSTILSTLGGIGFLLRRRITRQA